MSKEKLIPQLRFPKFKNEGEWKESDLGSVVEMKGRIGYRGYTTEDIVAKGKGAITLSPSNFNENGCLNFEKCTYISWEKYEESPEIQLEEGQTVLVKTASVGKTAYVDQLPEKATVNPQIVVLKPRSIHNRFLAFTVSHQNTQTQIRNNVGAGAIPNISQEIISKIKIVIPPDKEKKEQLKIASCLSSLDDLIAAHSQKLELLKDHKKGLMQNLFPQAGWEVPKLRFKEFEKDGEWKEDILFNLALDGFSNGVFNDPKKVGSGYKLINVINMYSESPISENNLTLLELNDSEFEKNKVKHGDIFFTRSSLVPEGIAKSNIYLGSSEDITYDGHLIRMRPNKELIYPVYLHYLLRTDSVRSQMIAKGKTATMTTIGQSDVASVKTSYSKNPKEQQKIASCLSSLDELITAQAEKIEVLKLHKKGLMQGLFPRIEN
jgi:type I restriction enzyme S subunit